MYTIGQLARRARINTDSVRFYERQGLLAPAQRTRSGYRLYTDEALERIEMIKQAQRCGFSLADMRELLQIETGGGALNPETQHFVHEKQLEIAKSIAALQTMSARLQQLAPQARADDARSLSVVPRARAEKVPSSFYGSV
jgi:MerR family Zn(II)-responsive transcriptional regulator of zntA